MPAFTRLASEIWRPYVIAGVPASGPNPPDKDHILLWGTEVENFIAGIGVVGPLVSLGADNVWTAHNTFPGNLFKFTGLATGVLFVDGPSGLLFTAPFTGVGLVVLSASPTISNPTFTGTVYASMIVVSNNTNGVTSAALFNTSAGAAAAAAWGVNNGTAIGNFAIGGTGYAAVPLLQNRVFVNASGGAGIALLTNDAQPIVFATNSIERGRIDTAAWNVTGIPLNINFNSSLALPSYSNNDIFLHAGGTDNNDGYLIFDTFGVGAQGHNSDTHILGRIARGSRASPSAVGVNIDRSPQVVSSGDSYLLVGAIPYGATGYSAAPTTFVVLQPAELQTDTAQGSRVRIGVTKSGTTTAAGGRYFWTFNNDGQLEINLNEVAPPTFALNSSSKLRVIGADNTSIFQSIEGYGASGVPGFNLSHALGTATSPSLVTNTTVLGAYGFNGYGASGFSAVSGAQMRALATQTWASGAEGTALELWTTANNSTTVTARVRVDHDGAVIATNASVNALAVGRLGLTTPALLVDASTASCVTGLLVTAKAAGSRLLLAVGSSGTDEGLSIDAKAAGSIRLGSISTGGVSIGGTTDPGTGGLLVNGASFFSGAISPTALSGDVNDYAPTGFSTAYYVRIDGGAADRNITGLAGGAEGRIVHIVNIGATNNITLKTASASSSAANRFLFSADVVITPNLAQRLRYDGTSSRWRQG